jgi:hypothetical protein
MRVARSKLFAACMLLLAALDTWVALASLNSSLEPTNWLKVVGALLFQALSVALLLFFVVNRPPRREPAPGPLEAFRECVTPYFLFAFAVTFSLSLMYNAVACGEQSFIKSRRGVPMCAH